MPKKIYILENLECANCASKIEAAVNALPDVHEATITFATKQLRLEADHPDELISQIQKIAASFEPDIIIIPRSAGSRSAPQKCFHEHKCSGHEHHSHQHQCSGHEYHTHQHQCSEHEHHSHQHRKKQIFTLENLDCAHCASKIESQILQIPEIQDASIIFATRQLQIWSNEPTEILLSRIQQVCSATEPGVTVTVDDRKPSGWDSANRKKSLFKGHEKELLLILSGSCLFIAGEVLNHMGYSAAPLALAICAYLILGAEIVLTALKNLIRGQIFDENFLMSLATIGAFFIGESLEAVGVMLFYRIGEFFEHIAVERSRSQIMEAVDLRPETVTRIENNQAAVIAADKAQIGDILLVKPGDRIPLDGIIAEGHSQIDTSPITGEPVPVSLSEGDFITSGCINVSGVLKIKVEKDLQDSMVTRILDSVENAAASKPKIDRFITRFARVYTPFVVSLALATAVIPSFITGNWEHWIYTAITFLVISCPCALVLSVPLAFFSGIGAGSKKGILFKGGISLEAMKQIKMVIMDKTGTITKGIFDLQEIVPHPQSGLDKDALLSLCAACEKNSTHPIAVSITKAAQNRGLSIPAAYDMEEIAGCGIRASLEKGEILCGNRKLMEQFKIPVDFISSPGYGSEVFVALNGQYKGYLVIADGLKEDSAEAIAQIRKAGIRTAMLTGDAAASAQAVAQAVQIDEVYSRLLPQDKIQRLQTLRKKYGGVMFIGDGINDAPVLAGADVGAAMGNGSDAAIEAADIVFMTSRLSAVPQAIAIARATNLVSWQNVIFALIVKALVMILGIFGFASMWMAVFADTGVAMICVLNSIRILYKK